MREIFINDTETTGIPDWKQPSGDDCQPHLVQVAVLVCDTDTREVKQSMDVIIKPDGWVIPEETIEVHGITNEYAHDVGIPEKLAFEMFFALWDGKLQVAHNTTFDRRIARIGTKRYFSEELQVTWKECEYLCTGQAARKIMGGKMPTLAEAYEFFISKPLENAHTAMADARACMEIYWAIMDYTEA